MKTHALCSVMIAFVGLAMLMAASSTRAMAGSQDVSAGSASRALAAPQVNSWSIAVGGYHACAVTVTGGVRCWGQNDRGQLGDGTTTNRLVSTDVSGLSSGVSKVVAGEYHTCALMIGGSVKCWGWNLFGQLGDGTTADKPTPTDVGGLGGSAIALTAGLNHTCALLTGGSIKCWGYNAHGQLGDGTTTNQPSPTAVNGLGTSAIALAAGGGHTCAVMTGGGIKCWGWNVNGQLGDGTTTDNPAPAAVTGLGASANAVTAGGYHTCALLSGGGLRCWGGNQYGQLGDQSVIDKHVPTDVFGLGFAVSTVSAGVWHTCAVQSGSAKCWGYNQLGQLGDGTLTNRSEPTDVTNLSIGVNMMAGALYHTCALMNVGDVKCWGQNTSGQLGNGTTSRQSVPANVSGLSTGLAMMSGGGYDTCAVTSGGAVLCWGWNPNGDLGDGTTTSWSLPTPVSGLTSGSTWVAAGQHHACAVVSGGAVKCWGANPYGQLGDGTLDQHLLPTAVISLTNGISAVTAGQNHTCALTTLGGVKCWGNNDKGQLGDGTWAVKKYPVDVVGLGSGVSAVTARGDHTCALVGGGVKCWGWNFYGQLGDGGTTNQWSPVDVTGLPTGVSALSAGQNHTCAVVSGGGVKCWGNNGYGQLGDGLFSNINNQPKDVPGLTSIGTVSLGANHTCALTTSGGLKCWGYNYNGQVGDGTWTTRKVPVGVVGMDSNVNAVFGGGEHTCALTNGRVKCWGWNDYGQLGIARLWIPVDVVGLSPRFIFLPLIRR